MKTKQNIFISTQDFSVSNESFDLVLDEELEMLITTPQPSTDNLGKYYESDSYISHTDSKQTFFDKIYQIVKSFTISQKVKLINHSTIKSDQKTLLDIGCGTGDFLVASQKKGWKVFGVEPNQKAIQIAKNKLNEMSVRAQSRTLPFEKNQIINSIDEFKNKQFDCITMWHVLEHIPDLKNYISSLKKLLKPNGTLIIAVPNYKSFDANYYGKFWAAYDVPRHLWHFSKKSIQLLFEKEQMKVVKTVPMKFDAYYVSLLSEKNKTGAANPIKAFLIGFRSNIAAIRSKEHSSIIYVIKNS